jgi:decaprenylphospho-beta-D-ribofuranose 2-oxidase
MLVERKRFVSFDGGTSEDAEYLRPDRYRMIEASLGKKYRIVRGGGYSYAAASFGGGSIVQDFTLFNRVLEFDFQSGLIKVEAGISLSDLLSVTVPRGFWLPVIPGYPAITVGGCVAANVHGKNPFQRGTFRNYVEELTLFHPAYGVRSISELKDPSVFHLTCGGYGLTGVIIFVTLRLEKCPGSKAIVRRIPVGSFNEGLKVISEVGGQNDFAYSIHQAYPDGKIFGRGYVNTGGMVAGESAAWQTAAPAKMINASRRGRIPFSVFGGLRTRFILAVHWLTEKAKPTTTTESLYNSLFPFVGKEYYFTLYGKRGLVECQVIVPDGASELFLNELQRLLLKEQVPAVMGSIKLFKGERRLLRFEMDGVCVALDLVRCEKTMRFLSTMDQLTISAGGIPFVIKDSRLPANTVKSCYPEYGLMKEHLLKYDTERLFRSEMSQRLGL